MSEATTATVLDGENNPENGEQKTFTQEDVNRFVSKRISEEKAKIEAELVKREQELQHKEFVFSAKETLTNKGLPHELLDALNTSSPEAFTRSLDILEQSITGIRAAKPTEAQRTAANDTLKALGAHDEDLDTFLLDKVDYDKISDPKYLEGFKEQYKRYFGETVIVGAGVATPPKGESTKPDPFEEGFNK